MKKLSEEDIKKEVSEILDDGRWKKHRGHMEDPYVYVKNLYTNEAGRILYQKHRTSPLLFRMNEESSKPQLGNVLVFDSLSAMVKDGWVVD